RYKSKERLKWEAEHDCLLQMREWMIASAIATDPEINEVEEKARIYVRECQKKAWNESVVHIKAELHEAAQLIEKLGAAAPQAGLENILRDLRTTIDPGRKEIMVAIRKSLLATAAVKRLPEREKILSWYEKHGT